MLSDSQNPALFFLRLSAPQTIFTLLSDLFVDASRAPTKSMSSYQTFEQAETKTFRPKKHSVMIAAVMVAAFWLGAACVAIDATLSP